MLDIRHIDNRTKAQVKQANLSFGENSLKKHTPHNTQLGKKIYQQPDKDVKQFFDLVLLIESSHQEYSASLKSERSVKMNYAGFATFRYYNEFSTLLDNNIGGEPITPLRLKAYLDTQFHHTPT